MRRFPSLILVFLLAACTGCGRLPSNSEANRSAGNDTLAVVDTFDAVALLGFGPASPEALPAAGSGEVVVRYGGWSLKELLATEVGRQLLWMPDDAKNAAWATSSLASGIYVIKPQETPSAIILASALLSYRIVKGPVDFDRDPTDPLLNMVDSNHCKDAESRGRYVGMNWGDDWGSDGKTHSIKLAIDPEYCHALGGGIWEAKLP